MSFFHVIIKADLRAAAHGCQRVMGTRGTGLTRSMVRQLKREAGIYRGAIATGDLAAQRAGQLVSLAEISEVAGIPRQQIATDLAAFSKAARRLFTQKIWPFRALDSVQGMTYMMQPEMAAWWLEE